MWIFFNFYVIQLLFAMCFMKTLMKVTNKHLGLIINKHCWSFDLFRFFPPSPCTIEVGKVVPEAPTLSSSYLSVFHLPTYLMVFICLYYWYIDDTKSSRKGVMEPVTDDWRHLPVLTLYQCLTSVQGKSQAPSRDRKRKQTFPVTINKLAPVLVTLKCVLLRYFCH